MADRVARAWRALGGDQRLAAVAALVLLGTLFLPWYDKSVVVDDGFVHDTLTGFGSADFVMASVVLVAFGVLALCFVRGDGRDVRLPFGDGPIVIAAGGWAALLVFYRVLDHPDVSGRGATIGIQWGVFVAFLAAALLVYAGYRLHTPRRPRPRPPVPREQAPPPAAPTHHVRD